VPDRQRLAVASPETGLTYIPPYVLAPEHYKYVSLVTSEHSDVLDRD